MLIPPTLARIPATGATLRRATTERPAPNPYAAARLRDCPECNGHLAHTSGCVTCLACGWGKCG